MSAAVSLDIEWLKSIPLELEIYFEEMIGSQSAMERPVHRELIDALDH